MISYCGLHCHTCPIHLATLEQDPSARHRMREDIARICFEQYAMKLSVEEVTDCDGCLTENGRLFTGCRSCSVRKCAVEKKVESCAFCSDYGCNTLTDFFQKDADARNRLEKMRAQVFR